MSCPHAWFQRKMCRRQSLPLWLHAPCACDERLLWWLVRSKLANGACFLENGLPKSQPASDLTSQHFESLRFQLRFLPSFSKHQRFPEWSWRSFRRNWWRTSGEVWKEIFELLLLGKSSEAFSTKTPPQISPSNFTTRFWVVAGPNSQQILRRLQFQSLFAISNRCDLK